MDTILGIDFGTTTTVVAYIKQTSLVPHIIEIRGKRSTDSVFRLDLDGTQVEEFGSEAWETILDYPDRTFIEFKRNIGTDRICQFSRTGRTMTPQELGVFFLSTIRAKIEEQFNYTPLKTKVVKCVIGYPAKWNENQRQQTIAIAREAGFPNVIGCEEPVGVLLYHHYMRDISVHKQQRVLVYDFGGGTTDVAILQTEEGDIRVIGIGGDIHLGGCHFDEQLMECFLKKYSPSLDLNSLSEKERMRLKSFSREIKEKLSHACREGRDYAELPIAGLKTSTRIRKWRLTRTEFESFCAPLISRFEESVESAIQDSHLTKEDIDISILAGGSARLYYVREKFRNMLPKDEEYQSPNPQEVIAKGLAMFGKKELVGEIPVVPEQEEDSPQAQAHHAAIKPQKSVRKDLLRRILLLLALSIVVLFWIFSTIRNESSIKESGEPQCITILRNSTKNDGVITEDEFEEAVNAYYYDHKRKVPKEKCRVNLKGIVLENKWEVKEGRWLLPGGNWFTDIPSATQVSTKETDHAE